MYFYIHSSPLQDQLPAEVLERVLDNLLHLSDLRRLRLVNRRLCQLADCLIERRKSHFRAALDGRHGLCWSRIRHVMGQPSPFSSLRLSAAVAKCGDYVYLFGGVSEPNQVPLNDLWRLSIGSSSAECRWERVMSSGQFPEPRSHASLTCYAGTQLVLFGGYLFHTSPRASVVGDVHVLDTRTHRWQLLLLSDSVLSSSASSLELNFERQPSQPVIEPLTSHAACIFMRKYLLITGGLTSQSVLSNRIWLINLANGVCSSAPHSLLYNETVDEQVDDNDIADGDSRRYPMPRHNHAMEALDDRRVVLCGGEVRPNQFCAQVWLLTCSVGPEASQSAVLSSLTWCQLAQTWSPHSPPPSRYLTACLLPVHDDEGDDSQPCRRLVCLSGAGSAYAVWISKLRERTLAKMLAQQQRQRLLMQQQQLLQQANQRPLSMRGGTNQRKLMRLQRLQEYQDRLALLQPHHHRHDGPGEVGGAAGELGLGGGSSSSRLRHSYLCPYVLQISLEKPEVESRWLEVPTAAGVSFESAPLDLHRYTALACQHQLLLLNCFCTLQRHFPVSHPFVQPVGLLSDDQQYRNAACEMFLLYPASRA